MPNLTALHWKKIECVFKKAGFKFSRQTDNHLVYTKDGILRPIIIPKYDEVGIGIIKNPPI
jgi:predicted RNA binding protein YcfA (HicA-like mRNA interferase family)